MSFHLTLTETAFAVPVGVIAGAALTFFAQRNTSKATNATLENVAIANLEGQRVLAQDDRLWAERTKAYAKMVSSIQVLFGQLHTTMRGLSPDSFNDFLKELDRTQRLANETYLIANIDVVPHIDKFMLLVRDVDPPLRGILEIQQIRRSTHSMGSTPDTDRILSDHRNKAKVAQGLAVEYSKVLITSFRVGLHETD